MKSIVTVKTVMDLERFFPLLKELRPNLEFRNYLNVYHVAHERDGYELVGIEVNQEILAIMGHRFLFDFIRGKYLYVDDLVTTNALRSKGLGQVLLKYAEQVAKNNGCSALRLCTGLDNDRGMNFYEKNGWEKNAFAYHKKI